MGTTFGAIDAKQIESLSKEELADLLTQMRLADSLPYVPTPKQWEFHNHPSRTGKCPLLYGGALAGGKSQPCFSSHVWTPFGVKTMGSIKVGDQVSNPDGGVNRVLQIHPQGEKEVFRITFTDKTYVDCTIDHLWAAWEAGKNYKKNRINIGHREQKGKIYTTAQLLELVRRGKKVLIPTTEPVQFTKTCKWPQRQIPPYVLGALLGDGHFGVNQTSLTGQDPEIAERIKFLMGQDFVRVVNKDENTKHYYFQSNPIRKLTEKLGLANTRSHDKFIPEEYKYGSIDERLELLKGLFDTDGTIGVDGKVYYCTISNRLALDVKWVIESLGGVATIFEKNPTYTYKGEKLEGQLAYTIYVKFPDPSKLFSLPRKLSRCRPPQGMYRRIVSIESIGYEECQCITVDNPNGLYLTDNFTVTHNSVALCGEAIREMREIENNVGLLARRELVTFRRTTLKTLEFLIAKLPFEVSHHKSEFKFTFPNGSILYYTGLGTEADKDKVKGLELGFLGIDEASEIERPMFQAAASRVRLPHVRKIDRLKVRLTSNPEPGWLLEDFIDNPRHLLDMYGQEILDENGEPIIAYHYIPATVMDNPHVIPEEYMADLRQMFSDNPAWQKAYIEGDWHAYSGNDQILPSHWVEEGMSRPITLGNPCNWGVDCSRFGTDKTVVAQRRGFRFDILGQWSGQSTSFTADQILRFYKQAQVKPRQIYIDDIGVGGGVVDQCIRLGLPAVGINVGRPSTKPDKFTRLKAELWWNFRTLMETNKVSLPRDPEVRTELTAMHYSFVPATQTIAVEDKAFVKRKIGRSPDFADALVLAAWEGSRSFVLTDEPAQPTQRQTLSPAAQNIQREQTLKLLLKLRR